MQESYYKLRSIFPPDDARSNGYRSHAYFEKEQAILLEQITSSANVFLDVACGTGLMLLPLLKRNSTLFGIDFDDDACIAARNNGVNIIRGNAYSIPIESNSIDYAISCQFLNQQQNEKIQFLLNEIYRILKNGGRLTLIWRNGDALVHKFAAFFYKPIDLLFNNQIFPYFNHSMNEVEVKANQIGFKTCNKETIFPSLGWRSKCTESLMSGIIGASFMLTIEK
jgi:ubiquinone/menaquinone biosynthesis C-methylase UbiE